MSERFEAGRAIRAGLGGGAIVVAGFGALLGVLGALLTKGPHIWLPLTAGLVGLGGIMFGLSRYLARNCALVVDDDGLTVVLRGKQRRVPWKQVADGRWSTVDQEVSDDAVPTNRGEEWVLVLTIFNERRALRIFGRDLARTAAAHAVLTEQLARHCIEMAPAAQGRA